MVKLLELSTADKKNTFLVWKEEKKTTGAGVRADPGQFLKRIV